MPKILITPRSFASYSDVPYKMLNTASIKYIKNNTGSIMEEGQLKQHIKGCDGIIVGVEPITKSVLKGSGVRIVSKYGVGTDNIDLQYCLDNNIKVTVTENANSEAVADYCFALILSVARKVIEIDNDCRREDWGKKIGIDVFGKKIGIIGLGAIGRGVVKRAQGFSMDVYGYDIFKDEDYLNKNKVIFSSVTEIVKKCDFVSLHLPLNSKTKYMINKEILKTAKPNLVLINTSRGGIIHEGDLYEALKNNQIWGAGLDVFENEPLVNSPLISLNNVVLGSHSAASTVGAVQNMSNIAVKNIIDFFENDTGRIL